MWTNFSDDFYEYLLQSIANITNDILNEKIDNCMVILWKVDYGEKYKIEKAIKRIRELFGDKVRYKFINDTEGDKVLTMHINSKYLNEIYGMCRILNIKFKKD